MKILAKSITKEEGGYVVLLLQDEEDLWHAYNLILPGDSVSTRTSRKVTKETASGATESEKVKIELSIQIQKIDFDPLDSRLRLGGLVNRENQWVKMRSHHTVELEVFKQFRLTKAEWDDVTLERLEEACSDKSRAQAAAIVMQEGVANICLLTEAMTLTKAKITQAIPRKRKTTGGNAHDKSVGRFFQFVYDSMLRVVDFSLVKAVIIASPGFVKDQFFAYALQAATKSDAKQVLENKSKFLLIHSSSGHRHALNEVLRDPTVMNALADTKAAGEVAALNRFTTMMAKDMSQVVYSKRHIIYANEAGAIDELLLSDNLFRARNVAVRQEYIELVDAVKQKGGKVHIFSSLHVSGEQLAQYSGVAAVLRFPLPDLDDGIEDEDQDLDAVSSNASVDDMVDRAASEDTPFGGTSIEVPYEEDEE